MHFLCTDSFYYCPKSLSTFWQREIFTMPQTTIHNTNSLRLIKYNSNSTAGIFIIINHLNIHPVIKAFNTFFYAFINPFSESVFQYSSLKVQRYCMQVLSRFIIFIKKRDIKDSLLMPITV